MADLFSKAVNKNNKLEPKINLTDAAKSPYGDLQITKYLYESGLQNIFSDYQKNIATLSKEKQNSLQEAYFIREMSRKYLGEYASNTGLNDVSGELLDLYGAYQQNISSIKEHYDTLQLNLTDEYNKARQEGLQNILLTDYGIEVAKLNEKTQQIMHNIIVGETEGQDPIEYLKENKNVIGESNYRGIYEALYNQGLLGQSDIEYFDIMNPQSERYVGDDYDFKLSTGENVDKNSIGFVDPSGNRKFSVVEDADNDPKYDKTGEELYEIFDQYYQEGKVNHAIPVQGDIVVDRAFNSESNSTEIVEYIYNNNKWHRLVKEKPKVDVDENIKKWRLPSGKKSLTLSDAELTKDSITVNGVNWKKENGTHILVDENFKFKKLFKSDNWNISVEEAKQLSNTLKNIHGSIGERETVYAKIGDDMYMVNRDFVGNVDIYKMKKEG